MLEGPGAVTFQNPNSVKCDAIFAQPGDYLLRLVGDDSELWTSDTVTVHILPPGVTVAKAWEFDAPLDKEGWTEADLGTCIREEKLLQRSYKSYPVNYVAGGYYIVALESAPAARLLSADHLDVAIDRHKTVRLRLQNHTTAERMTLRFVTRADGMWDDAKSRTFAVVPNDGSPRDYSVDMSALPGWTGHLRQLRLDLTDGAPTTGTCRFDYIRIDNSRPAAP